MLTCVSGVETSGAAGRSLANGAGGLLVTQADVGAVARRGVLGSGFTLAGDGLVTTGGLGVVGLQSAGGGGMAGVDGLLVHGNSPWVDLSAKLRTCIIYHI